MKRSILLACLIAIAALSFGFASLTAQQPKVEYKGPRVDRLLIKIYENPEAEALALKAGEIDIMDWDVPAEKIDELKADPNIVLYTTQELGMYEIDINHRMWPTSDVNFRRAIAHLMDKDRLVTEVIKGYAVRLDTPVPVILGEWCNPDVVVYDYNPAKAAQILDEAGFVDTDGDGIRNDPKTGKNLEPIIFYIRADDPYRRTAGEWLAEEMQKIGIPVDAKVVERKVCYEHVMIKYEYHLYTGGWGLGRDPDHLYDLYCSDVDTYPDPWSYNYPGFHNETFDYWARKLKFAPTKEEALEAAHKAQEVFAEQVGVIPLYCKMLVIGARKELKNVVNENGLGPHSWHTFLQAYKEGQPFGGEIRWGFKSDIESLNPCKAEWVWDWWVLDKIYDSLITYNPYELSEDWPALAKSWTIEKWTSPEGVEGLKITYKLCDNVTWHDGKKFTSADVKFSYEFLTHVAQEVSRWIPAVQNIVKVEAPDDYTVIVYANTTSFFFLHYSQIVILPKHIWEKHWDDWKDLKPDETGELIGTGPWKFVKHVPGEYVLLIANPNYYRRHPGKTIKIKSVSAPSALKCGETGEISVEVLDYAGKPITNATVEVKLVKAGTVAATLKLSHTSGGVYKGTITAPKEEGTYDIEVSVTYTNPVGTFKATSKESMTVTKAFPTAMAIGAVIIVIILAGLGYIAIKKRKAGEGKE